MMMVVAVVNLVVLVLVLDAVPALVLVLCSW